MVMAQLEEEGVVFIAGYTGFGSGQVVKALSAQEFPKATKIDTSRLRLPGVLQIIAKVSNKHVVFHPSIAGFSWLRD